MDKNTSTPHIAFLYPGYAAEDDYPRLAGMISTPAEVSVIHTAFDEDAHTIKALTEMGSPERLQEGAEQLKDASMEAVLWTSTSASFVRGIDGIGEQIRGGGLHDQGAQGADITLIFLIPVRAVAGLCM